MIDVGYIIDTPAELLVEKFMATTDYSPKVGREVDPWSYFGVPVGASDAAIKRSYRQVVRRFHPDRLKGLPPAKQALFTNEFKKAADNYKILTDPRSGKILRTYGIDGWREYKKGDTMRSVGNRLSRRYSRRYGIQDPLGPGSDPLNIQPFADPLLGEEAFSFDPNSTANEGRWRLRDPKTISRYFRVDSETPGVSYIMGKDRQTGETVIQAVRFNKVMFTEKEAARWWLKNKKKDKFKRLWTWKGKK